jgi:hypothetical protein
MMQRSEADQLIADLIEWAAYMGGFDSAIWKKACAYMRKVREQEDRDAAEFTRSISK